MLGYSARASSFSQPDLRKYYREIERLLYYHLPKDASAERTPSAYRDAHSLKRMVFIPEIGGLQVISHVCYRQKDVANRVGSYFAHVLLTAEENKNSRWSAVDCLRLWNSPSWVREDEPCTSL